MANKTPEKYDVRTIFASKLAEKNDAAISDITATPKVTKGITKIYVTLSLEAEDGWSDVLRFWCLNLPTPEDVVRIAGKKIVDLHLQRGWNEDEKQWGKIKVTKFILDGGEEVVLNGPKDAPGIEADAE